MSEQTKMVLVLLIALLLAGILSNDEVADRIDGQVLNQEIKAAAPTWAVRQ